MLLHDKCCWSCSSAAANVPGCKQRAGHTKGDCWVRSATDGSVVTVISQCLCCHVFPMFWIGLFKEIAELSSYMSTVLALPQAHWPSLATGPAPPASCLLWHRTDFSKEYSSFTGVGKCCCSGFLVTGLFCTQGLWNRGWNMPFSQTSSGFSCHIYKQNRSLNTCLLKSSQLGNSRIFQEQELVSPNFATSPAMQMSLTQRLFRKKHVMIMTEYPKHLMMKYYEIIRLNTEKNSRNCQGRFPLCFHVTI